MVADRSFQLALKRILDVLASLAGLVLFSPLCALIAILIKLSSKGPVLFRQERLGLDGQRFLIYKFRTMTEAQDRKGNYLPDAERLTRVGWLLRLTSLDELPELINVLRGDMSVVGPRPLIAKYESRYSPEQARRHEVRPGITGLAQINGRNMLTWEEKFALDVWYVDHWNLWIDLKIFIRTIWKVLRREGISQPGHATADEFRGMIQ
jgi:lipopolysaccharide/colanic/teichoic acid biosynthesis glycosyltransferase